MTMTNTHDDDATLETLRELVERLARTAAEQVRRERPETVTVDRTKLNASDVVTAADLAAERLLREILAAERPDDAILGEEGGATAGTSGLTWVVDPIDGTVNYLYGLPSTSVSVAVVAGEADPARWEVLAGAVTDITTGATTSAARGRGAHHEGVRLEVAEPVPLDLTLVATGFFYDDALRAAQGRSVATLLEHVRDIRRMGSAALDLCRVARRQVDAYYEEGLSPWDHAAGELIVREAGGVVVGLDGGRPGRSLVLAGHPETVARLEAILAPTGVGNRSDR
ncbi:inositol monophosphatase [Sanguibacter hominis ATCC BAA-789]|uniref:Inositol-1-monophosphatase n=2 Tax=Sanguibacter TaxID=60919 RepID=A0A9X5FBM4_9MICO|nr:inositol monophosphatase [Sanguibacter hominis ATCC BAA-789]